MRLDVRDTMSPKMWERGRPEIKVSGPSKSPLTWLSWREIAVTFLWQFQGQRIVHK
jgi:hypothetical protein